MGTRSAIGMDNGKGKIEWSYCHWDGYLSHNGRILLENYKTKEQVQALLEQGDMSSLGESVGEKHDFGLRVDGSCTFYRRDRGEDVQNRKPCKRGEFIKEAGKSWAEYAYLWDSGSGGRWLWTTVSAKGNGKWRVLTPADCLEKQQA